MVSRRLCRECIYRTWIEGCGFGCGYLLYTGRRRLPQMDPARPRECPVRVQGDAMSYEFVRALFQSQLYVQRLNHNDV